ncbi:DNA-binding SARP family transcriptional activator [Nonomuraea thailandensis]|uniref:DNA-binding SARP family transcriptional activator n=1 Tax=Nonomuraea thailandensis TaxID=1188745 RepID=A0A9X2GH33_9ACTN|nr:BTAD domain-containing putative transcriptional regulator [Nonomuraea thailandensis]MCP2358457.1 DNA-binding SARP family transcriptional activator [Nonomuraea thailandensis]
MQFRLLGAMEIFAAGRRIPIGSRKERLVLAVLLLEANRWVPIGRLVELAWTEEVPESARRTVQSLISRLRARLRMIDQALNIEREGACYRLTVDRASVDVHRFRDLLAAARDADDNTAAALYSEALSLWRGDGLTHEVAAEHLREELAELRLRAIEDQMDAELRLGRHRSVVGRLSALASAYPYRQRITGQLMLALHREGRSDEALECYRRMKNRLMEEVGLDPAEELIQLELAILRADPSLVAQPSSLDLAGVASLPPMQLPADIVSFSGREEHVKHLDALLPDDGAPPVATLVAIAGTAGIGKTTLAVHWAHRVRDRFPDGQLYVNLRGYGLANTVEAADALRGFLDALHVPSQQIPTDTDQAAAQFRSVLAHRRVLILLDNARDAEQVRPLLPGGGRCLVIVTSRRQMSGLVATEGARLLRLALFTTHEAYELLARRIDRERLQADPAAVEALITACGRLPLALAIAAARSAVQHEFPLRAIADQLKAGLAAFDCGDAATCLRTVFSWSYGALSEPAARLFRMLSLYPGAHFTPAAAASLTGARLQDAQAQLAELADMHLIDEYRPGRFTVHDLLRTYATELAEAVDPSVDRRAAARRALEHYLHSAHDAAQLLSPHRDPIVLPPVLPGVHLEPFADHDEALSWFMAQHDALLAAVHLAIKLALDAHVWQLAWSLADYLDRQGHWKDQLSCQRLAVEAAERSGHPLGRAAAFRNLARAHLRLTQYDDAHHHYSAALDVYAAEHDVVGQAHTYGNLSAVHVLQEDHHAALHCALQSLQLFERAGHRAGMARALNATGWYQLHLGDYDLAIDSCTRALELHLEIDDRHGQANTYDSLGLAHRYLGNYAEATACYQRSIDLYRCLGDRYNEADTLTHLGENLLASGDRSGADQVWRSALRILEDLGHPDAAKLRRRPPLSGGSQ